MLQNPADNIPLRLLDKRDDLHLSPAIRTFQWIDLVNRLYQRSPGHLPLHLESGHGLWESLDCCCSLFGSHAALPIRVPAVIPNPVLSPIRYMLSNLGNPVPQGAGGACPGCIK